MNTMLVMVEGMHCENCCAKIRNELVNIEGVVEVEVSLEEKRVTLKHDGRAGIEEAVVNSIESIDNNKFTVIRM